MSSGGTPYIGSKISLISKAKIRYEGFLYTIDTEESTVTLAKVKSFGTEDRISENRVPERNEIYEYIVFRGSDIDDLHVSEGPKSRSQVAQDPAIVQTGSAQPSMYQQQLPMQMGTPFPHQSYGPFGGIPTFGYPMGFRPPAGMSLSSVIGQGGMNDRAQRPASFDRNYRQSPSPPNVTAIGARHSHKEVREKRSISPDVSNSSRELYNSEKLSSGQAEVPQPHREQKRSWRNKEDEHHRERNAQRDHDHSTTRRQTKESDQQKSRPEAKDSDGPKENSRAPVKEQYRDKNKDQGSTRNVKRPNDPKQPDSGNYSKNNDAPRSRNNFREKERPRLANNEQKKDDTRKEAVQKEGIQKEYVEKEVVQEDGSEQTNSRSASSDRGRGRGRGSNRRGHSRGRGTFNKTKFDKDFDFESANAKFNKEEVERELLTALKKNLTVKDDEDVIVEKEVGKNAEVSERDIDHDDDEDDEFYYDKSKSFFDHISCDSAKKGNDVMTKRKERSVNVETFGAVPWNYRGRGRPYRGRGGRGYGRGGGGGGGRGYGRGHHSSRRGNEENRTWVDYEFDFEAAGIRRGANGSKPGGS